MHVCTHTNHNTNTAIQTQLEHTSTATIHAPLLLLYPLETVHNNYYTEEKSYLAVCKPMYPGFYIGFFGREEDDHVFSKSAQCDIVLLFTLMPIRRGKTAVKGGDLPFPPPR